MSEEKLLEKAAETPQTIDTDGMRVTERALSELIQYSKHKKALDVLDPFGVMHNNSRRSTH